jgi:hypothetical protein
MLASELRPHGVDVLVLEKDVEPSKAVRSLGLHPRPGRDDSRRQRPRVRFLSDREHVAQL